MIRLFNRMIAAKALVVAALVAVAGSACGQEMGPGVVAKSYQQDELYKSLSVIDSSKKGLRGHAAMQMFNGYLMGLEARDSGLGDGAIAFFDISDPTKPERVATYEDEDTSVLFEGHNYGFMTVDDRDIVFLNAQRGLQIWDWTDIKTPRKISDLNIPKLTKGAYANTIWWLAMQYPYIYLGGTNTGLHIIDASDLEQPKLAKSIPMSQLGGFKVGSLFACGNLLVCSTFDGPGISTLDISDPLNPKLLKTVKEAFGYSALFNGGYVYGIGEKPKIWDARTHGELELISDYQGEKLGSKGGYAVYQDGFLHQGASSGYAKIDVTDPRNPLLVKRVQINTPKRDFDGANVIGNYVVVSCDHGTGSHIIAHAQEPDIHGPVVNYINPSHEAKNIHQLSRIGLTFSDEIDHRSLSQLEVREVGGSAVDGHWSVHNAILNFTPAKPLSNGSTYEVILPKGSICDQMGNPIAEEYRSVFSTGENLSDFKLSLVKSRPQIVADTVHFAIDETGLSGVSGGDVEYAWDFGDGSAVREYSPAKSTSYTYAQPGRYTVIVHARTSKQKAAAQLSQLIYAKRTKGAAKHSRTIALAEDRNSLWCANSDNDTLSIIDANLGAGAGQGVGKKLAEIKVAKGPRTVSLSAELAVVVSEDDPTLTVIDLASREIKHRISLPQGSQPYGVVIDHEGKYAYISSQLSDQKIGGIFVVDCQKGEYLKTISSELMTGLRGLALDAAGKTLYATRFISKDTHAEVYAITLSDGGKSGSVKVMPLQIDTSPDTEDSGRGLPNYLSSIAISPNGSSAWVPSKKDNIERGLSRDGKPLTFESTVRPIASRIDLSLQQEDYSARHDFNDKEGPFNAVYSPYGDLVFVTMLGNNSVEIIDAYTGDHVTSILNVGSTPQGVLIDEKSSRLYVHSFLDRKVSIYDVAEILQEGGGYGEKIGEVKLVSEEKLDAFTLRGKKIFYHAGAPKMSRDAYISCASCHLDGGHDGRVWDFTNRGEGLRNTISLLGKSGVGHGLLHWSANFDEIQDFEHDIRSAFGGTGFISLASPRARIFDTHHHSLGFPKAGQSEDLDALAAYIRSLNETPVSPHHNDGELTSKAQRGKAIFHELNCASCHSGSEFTDSQKRILHDVGTLSGTSGKRLGATLKGIDTPSLKGLWASAPYLHDGSAKSLREVLIDRNKDGKHGMTAGLNEEELENLIAYLEQIDDSQVAEEAQSKSGTHVSTPVITYLELAQSIMDASHQQKPCPPITSVYSEPITMANAYKIQAVYDQLMKPLYGVPVGYKMAYASQASQEKWGIPAPVSGTFFKKQKVQSGGSVKAASFMGFHIESEVAFTLKKEINKPVRNFKELSRYIQSVHVGLDVPDLRYDKSKGSVQVADVIAMSCGTHTYVLGKGVPLKSINFQKMQLSLTRNGEEVYSGAASNVMGDPRESLRQLANRMLEEGRPLRGGQVVLTGSVAGAYFPKEKEGRLGKYIGIATGLPPVELIVK